MAKLDLSKTVGQLAYNNVRDLLGPDGDFEMLATSMSAEVSLLKILANDPVGWTADQTGPETCAVRVIDRPALTRLLIFGSGFNHFKVGDQLYHLDENGVTPPFDEPREWLFRGHVIRLSQDEDQQP